MSSLVLLDLDGTLVDTAAASFVPMKDGKADPDLDRITPFPGAAQLISDLKQCGHTPVIVSDSHPRYVGPVARALFDVPALHLADKPNAVNTRAFLVSEGLNAFAPEQTVVVGDSYLDVLLARALRCPAVFTRFYRGHENTRDGTGNTRKGVKAGAACVASTMEEVLSAVEDPAALFSAAESVFAGHGGSRALRYTTRSRDGAFFAVRALGRQQSGECDARAVATQYYELCHEDRPASVVAQFAEATRRYLAFVMGTGQSLDVLSHVADKATTTPPDKLSALAEAVDCGVPHQHLFEWVDGVDGSIRHRPKYLDRARFVRDSLRVRDDADVQGKVVVVLDDQITTGATANTVDVLLRERGARSVLFVAMVCLVDNVPSEKTCPKCGTRLDVKINRAEGTRFLSCTLPRYRGTGCGYSQSLD